MKNIKILDCTLRDGGRVINCAFSDDDTKAISRGLAESNIDIIEVGFLRNKIQYSGNSTFFTDVTQMQPFIDKERKNTEYVAFIDYGMFDFKNLKPCDGMSIDGIRVGFVKKDVQENYCDLVNCLKSVKEKGYKLYIQGVNSLGYSDLELLQIVKMVNEIRPYSFGIVDTYGGMYIDDVQRLYSLIDHNLNEEIAINFHSHNNFQLSFSFAQEVIRLSRGVRDLIIDATLNGMGKCAGNLNTELIVDYLIRKLNYNYNYDSLLDIIDEYIYDLKEKHFWGYSIPAAMAGIYQSHPNNIIYLTEKFRLATKDIKSIISMISPEVRKRYDYDNIQRLYVEYNHTKVDDKKTINKLKKYFENKKIIVLCPGNTLALQKERVESILKKEENLVVISVNCILESVKAQWAFWGSNKRYKKFASKRGMLKNIVVSNVESENSEDYIVNYEGLIYERNNEDFDNTMILLLNLLKKLEVKEIFIAGLDGFKSSQKNYIDNSHFSEIRFSDTFERTNKNMKTMLEKYWQTVKGEMTVKVITDSIYSEIFEG